MLQKQRRIMMKFSLRVVFVCFFLFGGWQPAFSAQTCSASNESGGRCTANCKDGEIAVCYDESGANEPVCLCKQSEPED